MNDEYIEHLKEIIKETESRATEWLNKYSDLEEKYLKLTQELNNAKFVKIKDLREEIKKLQKEVNSSNKLIQQLNYENSEMLDKADNGFENSSTYKQMDKQIKVITDTAEHNRRMYEAELKRNDELIKEFQKLKNENKLIQKVHNERGAGRKARFSDEQIETIRMYRLQGKTIKEISEMFDCSVGLIHKLINHYSD
jgi:chromosome segregation ATPase